MAVHVTLDYLENHVDATEHGRTDQRTLTSTWFEYQLRRQVTTRKWVVVSRMNHPGGEATPWESAMMGAHTQRTGAAKALAHRLRGDFTAHDPEVFAEVEKIIAERVAASRAADEARVAAEAEYKRQSEEHARLSAAVKAAKFKSWKMTAPTGGDPIQLSGQAYRGLLVHVDSGVNYRGKLKYIVSHIASGKRLGAWEWRDGAKMAAYRLAELADWTVSEDDLDRATLWPKVVALRESPTVNLDNLPPYKAPAKPKVGRKKAKAA